MSQTWTGWRLEIQREAAVAAEALRTGIESLEWGVHHTSVRARRFCDRLGTVDAPAAIMGLDAGGRAVRARE